jgi:hypothetical protein
VIPITVPIVLVQVPIRIQLFQPPFLRLVNLALLTLQLLVLSHDFPQLATCGANAELGILDFVFFALRLAAITACTALSLDLLSPLAILAVGSLSFSAATIAASDSASIAATPAATHDPLPQSRFD